MHGQNHTKKRRKEKEKKSGRTIRRGEKRDAQAQEEEESN